MESFFYGPDNSQTRLAGVTTLALQNYFILLQSKKMMLKLIWDYVLIKKIEQKQDWVIAKPKDDKFTKGTVLSSRHIDIRPGAIVHFPPHAPQKIDHTWKEELYVIKEEDVLLLATPKPTIPTAPTIKNQPLDPKPETGWPKQ